MSLPNLLDFANLILSHVVIKIRTNEDGSLKAEGRILVHGNQDAGREVVRSDSAAAGMIQFRLVIGLKTLMDITLGTADIKWSYIQSGSIRREMFFWPSKNCDITRGDVWRLLKFPYRMTDAGCKCFLSAKNGYWNRMT